MRNLPPSIEPDGIYRSDELAEFWHISRDNRREWYRVLRSKFETTAAKVGDHFIVTGRDALASLCLSSAGTPAKSVKANSQDS